MTPATATAAANAAAGAGGTSAAISAATSAATSAAAPAATPAAKAIAGATATAGATTTAVTTTCSLAQAGLGPFGVIVLILALAWLARRAGFGQQGQRGAMRVVDSTLLSARQRVVMVEVGGTWLVLGVSAGEIRMLHAMPAGTVPVHGAMPPAGGFGERLVRAMRDKVKQGG